MPPPMMMVRDMTPTLTRGRPFRNPARLAIKARLNREPLMPSRLVLAALMPRDVVTRARDEFDAVVVEGKDDMTAAQVIEAAVCAPGRCDHVHQHAAADRGCDRATAGERARRRHQQRRL